MSFVVTIIMLVLVRKIKYRSITPKKKIFWPELFGSSQLYGFMGKRVYTGPFKNATLTTHILPWMISGDLTPSIGPDCAGGGGLGEGAATYSLKTSMKDGTDHQSYYPSLVIICGYLFSIHYTKEKRFYS